MTYFRHATADDVTLQLRLFDPSTQLGVTGAAPTVQIRRHRATQGGPASDDYYWNGTIFTNTPTQLAMTEFDAVNDPGLYLYFFDQSVIGVNQLYLVRYEQLAGVAAGFAYEQHMVTDEISVPTSVPVVPVLPGDTVMGRLADMENSTSPVALANADAVWDESLPAHLLPGSTGEALDKAAKCAGGVGSSMVTLTIEDTGSSPIAGAQVDVFDGTNTNFILRANTDLLGQVILALDDGSYAVRLFASGYSFTIPEPLTVSGTTAVTYTGTGLVSVTPPSAPDLCVIFGTLRDASGNPHAGVCLEFTSVVPQVIAGVQDTDRLQSVVTDVNGYFEIELVQNTLVAVVAEDAGIDLEKTVPATASQDFTTWT